MFKRSLVAGLLLVASVLPSHSEPLKLTVAQLREIKSGLTTLMIGQEVKVREAEKDRIIHEYYHFTTSALDNSAARNAVRVDEAIKAKDLELMAVYKRVCPTPSDCNIAKEDDTATKEKKAERIRNYNEEQDRLNTEEVTVDLIRWTEQEVDNITPRITIFIRASLLPLIIIK